MKPATLVLSATLSVALLASDAALAHCVESPGQTCIWAPCHHPDSAECAAEKQFQQQTQRQLEASERVTETPMLQRVADTLIDILIPAESAAAEEYAVPKEGLALLAPRQDEKARQRTEQLVDKLFPTIPPPPGTAPQPKLEPQEPPTPPQYQLRAFNATRDLASNAAAIQAVVRAEQEPPPLAPSAIRQAPIPEEIKKRNAAKLGAAYRQLEYANQQSRAAELGSRNGAIDITPQSLGTPQHPNLNAQLEQVARELRRGFDGSR